MSDFVDLKEQINDLIDDLDEISVEVKTYTDTTEKLSELANSMSETCRSLSKIIDQSSKIYEYVNETAVKETLSSFRKQADEFSLQSKKLSDSILSSQKKFTDECRNTVEELAYEVNRKVMILGGISVVCSLVALVLAFVR